MKSSIYLVGDHARILASGLREVFGTHKGLSRFLTTDGIVTHVDRIQKRLTVCVEDEDLTVSFENAMRTMPVTGFPDIPDLDQVTQAVALPSIKEELDRKTGDTLDWLIQRHKTGQISNEAMSVASDALFMAVSGLTHDQLVEVITSIGSYLPTSKPAKQARIFTGAGGSMTVTWTPGEDCVWFYAPDGRKTCKQCEDPAAARVLLSRTHEALEKRGYTEEK